MQLLADRGQVVRTTEFCVGHSSAVGSGAKEQARIRAAFAQPAEDGIGDVALRCREGSPTSLIFGIEVHGNIIEQKRETFAAESQQLTKTALDVVQVRLRAVADAQAGAEGIEEANLACLAGIYQMLQPLDFCWRVSSAPVCAVFEVILRSIKIGVQAPRLHPVQQFMPLLLGPRLPVKALNDS